MPYRVVLDWLKEIPWYAKLFFALIIITLYKIGPEQFIDEWKLENAYERHFRATMDSLNMRMLEVEYRDSVRAAVESVYIDLALTNGFKAYGILDNLIDRTNSERSAIFTASGLDTLRRFNPAYGTFLAEIADNENISIMPDWDNSFIPVGFKRLLLHTVTSNEIAVVDSIETNSYLDDPVTLQYLRSKEVKSLMAGYMGRSPINNRRYFLITFYHSDYLRENNINNDIFYTRNACVSMQRLFSLLH